MNQGEIQIRSDGVGKGTSAIFSFSVNQTPSLNQTDQLDYLHDEIDPDVIDFNGIE